MNVSDGTLAKRFLKRLKDLSTDEHGGQGYRSHADALLRDISGLEHVATIVLSHRNPAQAAVRMINHPRSEQLAKMLLNEADFAVLNELVSMAYMAQLIRLKPKRDRTREDYKTYNYLEKMYRKAVRALKKKYGYDLSGKKEAKNRFSAVRSLVRGRDEFEDDFFGDDDEYDEFEFDEGDDEFEEGDEDDNVAVNVINDLIAHGYKITPPARRGMPSNYDPFGSPEFDFDFSGKATLETISDRLLTIAEGLQLVINRIYGRKVDMLDYADQVVSSRPPLRRGGSPISPLIHFPTDLSQMSREDLIRLYNALGSVVGGDSESEDGFEDEEDGDGMDELPPSFHTTNPRADLNDQLDMLRRAISHDAKVEPDGATPMRPHGVVNANFHTKEDEDPPEVEDGEKKGEEVPPPPPPEAGPTAADLFNGANKKPGS